MGIAQDENLILCIDESWSNDYGLAIKGWIVGKDETVIEEVMVCVGETCLPITNWHPRPDVIAAFPQYNLNNECGFLIHVPRMVQHEITFKAQSKGKIVSKALSFDDRRPPVCNFARNTNDDGIFPDFINHFAKKVSEINPDKLKWEVTLEDVLTHDTHYPKPNA